jgi:hypothetical protein
MSAKKLKYVNEYRRDVLYDYHYNTDNTMYDIHCRNRSRTNTDEPNYIPVGNHVSRGYSEPRVMDIFQWGQSSRLDYNSIREVPQKNVYNDYSTLHLNPGTFKIPIDTRHLNKTF